MGPTWPFLLMYEPHDMRHTGFRRLTVVNETPRDLGRNSQSCRLLFKCFNCLPNYINNASECSIRRKKFFKVKIIEILLEVVNFTRKFD